jgi:hypothetical protein
LLHEAEELCKKLEDEADPTKLLERTEELGFMGPLKPLGNELL